METSRVASFATPIISNEWVGVLPDVPNDTGDCAAPVGGGYRVYRETSIKFPETYPVWYKADRSTFLAKRRSRLSPLSIIIEKSVL